jgi:hypothetical protein
VRARLEKRSALFSLRLIRNQSASPSRICSERVTRSAQVSPDREPMVSADPWPFTAR